MEPDAKDFHVTIKIRNGRILAHMRKLGIKSGAQLARIAGVNQTTLSAFLTFRYSPLLANGEWSQMAFALSSALHCEPEDLWPEHLARLKARSKTIELDMNIDELDAISFRGTKDHVLIKKQINDALKHLTPREQRVLIDRYGLDGSGEKTFADVGEIQGVGPERIRQIEARAFRRLRYRSKEDLIDAAEELGILPHTQDAAQ